MQTNSPYSTLNQYELLQRAILAGEDRAAALSYLQEAASRSDVTASARFLLGMEYAQLGLYERAIAELELSIDLDPTFFIVRFQLGLLWLTSGDAARATLVLNPLTELDSRNALSWFSKGLIDLMNDRFDDVEKNLKRGISLNHENPPLNANMQKIIDEVNLLQESGMPSMS
jgi:tetratricopeptide (TPR) repeat protein